MTTMWPLVQWVGVRHWLRHPMRAGLTVLGIALGVAVTVSVDVISGEILRSHRRTLESIAGAASLTVTAGEAGLTRDQLERIRQTPGVAFADPLLEQMVIDPKAGPVLLLGVDLLESSPLRKLAARAGDEAVLQDPLSFLNSTTSVLVTESFAKRRGLEKGSPLELIGPAGKLPLVVEGLLKDEGAAQALGGELVVMFLDAAQVAMGLGERLTRIDLLLDEGASPDTVREALRTQLGPGAEVEPPLRRGARMERLMAGLQQALNLMAGLALWLGALLAYNAVEISVRQRKAELGLLRALGASRAMLFSLVLIEAALLGALATGLGLGLGTLLARQGVTGTAAAVSRLFEVVRVDELHLLARDLWAGALVGIGVPVVAALRPARWISRQPPVTGMREPVEQVGARVSDRSKLALGAALTATGVGLLLLPAATRDARLGLAGFGLVLAGAVFLAPALLAVGATWTRRRWEGRLGIPTLMALDHLVRDRQRAALTVASLVGGVATVLTLATYVTSLEGVYEEWLDSAYPADLVVTAGAKLATTQNLPLSPGVGGALGALEGVERVFSLRLTDIDHRGRPIKLASIELTDYRAYSKTVVLAGRQPHEGIARGTHVVVSENLARREGYVPEGPITLDTPSGPRTFQVGSIVADYLSDQGVIFLDRATYVSLFRDPSVDSFNVFLRPGVEVEKVQERIRVELGERHGLFVLTHREFKKEATGLLAGFFALLKMLQGVTLLMAVLGVSTTLVSAVLDRLREIGVLRALGCGRGQLMRMVLTEAGLLGGGASVLGAALGTGLGVLFLRSLLLARAGWSIPSRLPLGLYAPLVLGVILASLCAALYPAWWAAQRGPGAVTELR